MNFYKKQAVAIQQAQPNEKVFAKEVNKKGCRTFYTSTPEQFWIKYKDIPPKDRTWYEVVRDEHRVKGFWDIEYSKQENKDKNGEESVFLFMKEIIQKIRDDYGEQIYESDFTVLEAHSQNKFSVHLILDGKITFRDVNSVSHFTEEVMQRLNKEILKVLKNGKEDSILDMRIYTKNRNFRLYLSTKFNQERMLRLSDFDLKHLEGAERCDPSSENTLDRYIFYQSLVEIMSPQDEPTSPLVEVVKSKKANPMNKPVKVETRTPSQGFDHVELDLFIKNKVGSKEISRIIHYSSHSSVYNFKSKIYCKNIEGSHKNNNSYVVLNKNTREIYMKCHSNKCFGKRYFLGKIPDYIKV